MCMGEEKVDRELEFLKKVIVEEVEKAGFKVSKIILFGSRARGDATQESDWDLLVIVNEDISFDELKKLTADIQLRLAALSIPNDVIIRGIKQFEASKTIVGNISYFADKEGIKI